MECGMRHAACGVGHAACGMKWQEVQLIPPPLWPLLTVGGGGRGEK
jgi:hypothetical protein